MLASCEKELPHRVVTPIDAPAETYLSIEGVGETFGLMAPKTKSFPITIKADTKADQLLTFTVAPNPDKVAAYNAANGTDYEMVPGDAYELSTKEFMLPRYNTVSSSGTLTIKANGLPDDGKTRVLPISITKVEGDAETKMDASDSTVFITVYRVSLADIRFEKGKGTQAEPYLVEYGNDMLAMINDLKSGEPTYIKLAADIDMSSIEEWMPVNATEPYKTIHFDGDGHTISNLYSNAATKCSLFGALVGSVRNVTFENCTLEPGVDATGTGLVAGYAKNATIENVTVKGLVVNSAGNNNNGKHLGGLVGIAEDCVLKNNNVEVNIPDHNEDGKNPRIIGGMVGALQGTTNVVDNCHTKGNIYANVFSGGLIGAVAAYNQEITNCTSEVNMTTIGNYCGVMIGYANKGFTILDCAAKGNHVSNAGTYNYKGGFMGACQGGMTAKRCSWVGDYDNLNGTHIGGFIGNPYKGDTAWNDNVAEHNSLFEDCYTSGSITVSAGASNKGRMQGGFVGVIEKGHGVTIRRCYSDVNLSAKGANGAIGGLVGVAVETSTNLDVDIDFTMESCIAWNAVIDNEAPDINGGYGVGALCGAVAKQSTLSNNYRRADMKLIEIKGEGTYTVVDQPSADVLAPAGARCPYHGVAAAADATCSSVAKSLNWPEDVWDLSEDLPKLK